MVENETYFSIKAFKVFLPRNLPKTRMCCREDGTFNRVRAEMEKTEFERLKGENSYEDEYRWGMNEQEEQMKSTTRFYL